MSTFPQNGNHSCSFRTSIQEDAIFCRMSYCKFLWGNPCKAIATFYHWGFYLWDFGSSMVFAHSAAWKNSETDLMVNFSHAYPYRDGNCNCLLSHIARWLPIANNILKFFVHAVLSLILDHGVLLKISASGSKVLISNFLLDTSFHHSFQSVIIRS